MYTYDQLVIAINQETCYIREDKQFECLDFSYEQCIFYAKDDTCIIVEDNDQPIPDTIIDQLKLNYPELFI